MDEGTVALHEAFKHCVLRGMVSFHSCTKLQTEIVPVLSPDKWGPGTRGNLIEVSDSSEDYVMQTVCFLVT